MRRIYGTIRACPVSCSTRDVGPEEHSERNLRMPSIVIAAHNEENVIGRSLDALLDQADSSQLQVVVSANGCTDRTAAVATRAGVIVIDRPEPGKAAALNAGDQAASGFPRIYLDADILVPSGGLAAVLDRFAHSPSPLAVVPRRRLNLAGRPWPVRGYFAISERLPAFRNGLFGRGMIALSEQGRARFDAFPVMIADDLFIDSLFSDAEKAEASGVEVVVEVPFTTRDLIRRLVRVRRGNTEMRAASAAGLIDVHVRPTDRWAWLRDVVLPNPRLAAAAIPYVSITVIAGVLARRQAEAGSSWGRDESTRGKRPQARNGAST
ncbi:MAG: glycosyltransferase [Microbacterium sp.]